MVRAGDRAEYFPVFFVEPLKGNEKALGFDLASDPVRNESLRRSAAEASVVATSRIKLVQEVGDQYGFLVFRPVYRGGLPPASEPGRREQLLGFVLAVFRVGDIVEKAVGTNASGLHVVIFDLSAKPRERLLYPKSARFDGVDRPSPGLPGYAGNFRLLAVAGCWSPIPPPGVPAGALEQLGGAGGWNAAGRSAGRRPSPESQPPAGNRAGA